MEDAEDIADITDAEDIADIANAEDIDIVEDVRVGRAGASRAVTGVEARRENASRALVRNERTLLRAVVGRLPASDWTRSARCMVYAAIMLPVGGACMRLRGLGGPRSSHAFGKLCFCLEKKSSLSVTPRSFPTWTSVTSLRRTSMGVVALSNAERRFIVDGAQKNVRSDGRQQRELRDVEIACGVIAQATGSARVRIGGTDVIVGVKAEIGTPDVETPGLGAVECSVECSPLASPKFRGRGGDELSAELSTVVEKSFGVGLGGGQGAASSSALDLASLCILAGKSCWVLYVDALVLDLDGSVVDAISVACRAALEDAKIPKVEIQGEGDDQDFEVDEEHVTRLDVGRVPLSLSVGLMGTSIILDLTGSEEEASTAVLSVSTNPQGDICGVSKLRGDGMAPALLMDMIGSAKKALQERHDKVSGWLTGRMATD